jgi:hypothetical protein
MPQEEYPPLPLYAWQETRDTLRSYCRVLGGIHRQLSPPQKHWWHISLRVTGNGLTTAAIPRPGQTAEQFEINLDLEAQRLTITTSWGVWWEMPIAGQPPLVFAKQMLGALEYMNIPVEIDRSDLELLERPYDISAAQSFGRALSSVNTVFNRFKSELNGESSQVQFWPHNFDLALMWLSGRKVSGVDPSNEELADERISFGFSTGDSDVPEPYCTTIYPGTRSYDSTLPDGAGWYTPAGRVPCSHTSCSIDCTGRAAAALPRRFHGRLDPVELTDPMTTTSIPVILLLNPNEPEAVLSLAVQPGQQVSKGELICTLETTKSTAEVTAEAAGYVAGLRFQAGQTVTAGEILCYLAGTPDWVPPEASIAARSGGPVEGTPPGLRISQPALEMARQAGIDLEKLPQGPFITESSLRPLIEKALGRNFEPAEAGFDPTAILIFGGGGHGKSLIDLLRLLGTYRLAGVVDDNLSPGEQVLGVPVVGGSDALPSLYAQGIAWRRTR